MTLTAKQSLLKTAHKLRFSKWLQHHLAQDKNGNHVRVTDKKATQFCVLGAMCAVAGDTVPLPGYWEFEKFLKQRIIDFNNTPGRTKKEVIDALLKCAEQLP